MTLTGEQPITFSLVVLHQGTFPLPRWHPGCRHLGVHVSNLLHKKQDFFIYMNGFVVHLSGTVLRRKVLRIAF